jgi:hypothetical protein
MRTSEITEMHAELNLATKLKDEAAAWRKSRPARDKFSMAGSRSSAYPNDELRTPPSVGVMFASDVRMKDFFDGNRSSPIGKMVRESEIKPRYSRSIE